MKKIIFSSLNFGNDGALLLLRITCGGLMMLNHGIGKIEKLQSGSVKFMDFMGLGPKNSLMLVILAEVICSFLIMIGFATRLATIPLIINMLVATFVANSGKPFKEIELPLFFLLSFIVLFITGPGQYSFDKRIGA